MPGRTSVSRIKGSALTSSIPAKSDSVVWNERRWSARRTIDLAALFGCLAVCAAGQVHGLIENADGAAVAGAQVVVHSPRENIDRAYVSAADGSFTVDGLKPGQYQFKAMKRGLADSPVAERDLTDSQDLTVNLTLGAPEG